MTRWDGPCGHHTGGRPCGAKPTRRYLQGRRCAQHTPAALAGQPRPAADATPWTPLWPSTLPPLRDTRGRAEARAALRPRPHDGED